MVCDTCGTCGVCGMCDMCGEQAGHRPSRGFDNARGVFSFSHGVAEMNAGPQARACDIPSAHRLERSMRHDDERWQRSGWACSVWKPKTTMRGSGRVQKLLVSSTWNSLA